MSHAAPGVRSIALIAALAALACGDSPTTSASDGGQTVHECPNVLIPDLDCLHEDCCRTTQDCIDYALCRGQTAGSSTLVCNARSHRCLDVEPLGCTAATEANVCCPGQQCTPITNANGICADRFRPCDSDAAACNAKGQYCEPSLGTPGIGSAGCTFKRCVDGACDNGLACFNGYCVGEAPCSGGCLAGEVCTAVNNMCFGLGPSPHASCRQSCPSGSMLVFANGDNVFAGCDMSDRTCRCEPIPTFE